MGFLGVRPFVFMVALWGPTYRQYFVDRCMASLLAPGNLPQLRAQDGHRLLIATTLDDWRAIEHLPIIQAIRQYVTPVHLAIEPPVPTPPGSEAAILQQNRCHKLLLEAAYSYRSYGCMLWPDIIFSDGLGVALQRWAAEGQELVLFASLRHVQEAVMEELALRGLLPPDANPSLTCSPLVIPPQILADISIRHLHPEVLVYDFEDRRIPIVPPHVYARMRDDRGIALHTFHGQQILMDFAALRTHNTDCLARGLFEDVYLDENFADCRKIHIVRDFRRVWHSKFNAKHRWKLLQARPHRSFGIQAKNGCGAKTADSHVLFDEREPLFDPAGNVSRADFLAQQGNR